MQTTMILRLAGVGSVSGLEIWALPRSRKAVRKRPNSGGAVASLDTSGATHIERQETLIERGTQVASWFCSR
jgi:hypothetical protein